MKGYNDNIETLTIDNGDFRRVLYTGKHLQLVLMNLQPGEEIGSEVHDSIDQFFRFEEGEGWSISTGSRIASGRSGVSCRRARATMSATPERAAQALHHLRPARASRPAWSRRPSPRPKRATTTRNWTARPPNNCRWSSNKHASSQRRDVKSPPQTSPRPTAGFRRKQGA